MSEGQDHWKLAVKKRVASSIAIFLIRAISSTLRLRVEGLEQFDKPFQKLIFCGWHGKSFMFANFFRHRKYWVIISHSNDGDIQNRVFSRLGYQTIRGSSGRGGVRAALEAVRKLKEGGCMAITVDGPRGPAYQAQGGVMLMAQKSGARLVPVGLVAERAFYIRSWDKYMIPIPFSRAKIVFGTPLLVPSESNAEEVESIRVQLEASINEAEQSASKF